MDASRWIASGKASRTKKEARFARQSGGVGFRESRNRATVLAGPNSRKLASSRRSKSGTGQNRLAHVSSQPFNVTTCAWRRSQGATRTLAACRYSDDDEDLHASSSHGASRSEQQSRSSSATCAGCLKLMAPFLPSQSHKSLLMKEMLVGAVGIEPTTFGLKGRCSTTELHP